MKRNEIETKYTWDLTKLFPDQQAFDNALAKAKQGLAALIAMKGHLADTKDHFICYMETKEDMERYLEQCIVYANMSCDVEPSIPQNTMNKAAAMQVYQQAMTGLSFCDVELIEAKEAIDSYLQDEACSDFRYPMSELFRTIPHRLDAEKEQLLAEIGEIATAPAQIYDAFRMRFDPVMVDGEEQLLSDATYTSFLFHPDVEVRKQAFTNLYQEYERYGNAFAQMLKGHAKGQVFNAKMRNFSSALEASLFADGADQTLYDKVLHMANEKYKQARHDFFAFRKEQLGLKEQHTYDLLLPYIKDVNVSYTIEESFDIIRKALAPLGETYGKLLTRAQEERWVDCFPHEQKVGGAYSGGCHDSLPYILTNFTGNYDSLSTLAHELGHSMHSYFSRTTQRPLLSDYRIFVAEVASTVNEILLNNYLLKTSDDRQYRKYILANLLEQLVGTLYRQPMYAKFESHLHELIEQDQPVSSSVLTDYFIQLSKDYYGESVCIDELEGYKCYYIPHFYYNFYVYKYTLGMAVALSFVKKIEAGEVADYLAFLSKGGSESPIDELVHAGVDPRSDAVYDDAFTYFEDVLKQLKELM